MKKVVSVIAVIALIIGIGCFSASADQGGYTITSYDFKGVLHENNTVSVTETINANFSQSRHGIYRQIPLYMDVGGAVVGNYGTSYHYLTEVKNISVDGFDYDVEEDDGICDIRIGSEYKYVEGNQKYVIHYTYVMPDDRLDSTDFLFYSVLGADWGTTIDKFTFDLKYDKPIPKASAESLRIYSGYFGGESDELGVKFKSTVNGVSGSVKDIRARRAVTVFTKLPQGYFVGAKTVSPIPSIVFICLVGIVALITLILLLTVKRVDIVQTVEFYPPKGITPADVGTIIDESADDIDLMSLIPYWAQKGYITIEEIKPKKKVELVLTRVNQLPSNAPEYEKRLFNGLFKSDDICNLSHLSMSFADKFADAKRMLGNSFTGDRALSKGYGKAVGMTFLGTLFFFGAMTFSSVLSTFDHLFIAVFASLPVFVFGVMTTFGLRQKFKKVKGKIVYGFMALICLGISAGVITLYRDEMVLPVMFYYIVLGVAILIPIMAIGLTQNTEYRAEMLGKLLGLKDFIDTAEIDRLKYLLEENSDYYYEILPYAMVFGMLDKWSKRFDGLAVKAPSWYSPYDRTLLWETYYLNSMLRNNIREPIKRINAQAAAARAAASARSAASSSGGGFSGGGGGGGGGGSW